MSAVASRQDMQDLISARELGELFREHLGWDNPQQEPLPFGSGSGSSMAVHPVASKRAVDVWRVPCPVVPAAPERHKIIRRIRKLYSLETLVVFDGDDGDMLWLWPEQRPAGDSYRAVEHPCERDAVGEEMLDRLAGVAFTLDEEDDLAVSDVLSRVRRSLGVDIAALPRRIMSGAESWPIRTPTLARGTVVILSTIRRHGSLSPFCSSGATGSRMRGASVGSVVNAHTVTEFVPSKRSSCSIATGRGLPAYPLPAAAVQI